MNGEKNLLGTVTSRRPPTNTSLQMANTIRHQNYVTTQESPFDVLTSQTASCCISQQNYKFAGNLVYTSYLSTYQNKSVFIGITLKHLILITIKVQFDSSNNILHPTIICMLSCFIFFPKFSFFIDQIRCFCVCNLIVE